MEFGVKTEYKKGDVVVWRGPCPFIMRLQTYITIEKSEYIRLATKEEELLLGDSDIYKL